MRLNIFDDFLCFWLEYLDIYCKKQRCYLFPYPKTKFKFERHDFFSFHRKKKARNNGPIQVLDTVLKRKSFLTLNSYMPKDFIFPWNNLGKLDLRMFFLRNDTVGIFNYKWFGSNKTNAIIRVGQLFLNGSLFWHHKHKLDGYDFIFYS